MPEKLKRNKLNSEEVRDYWSNQAKKHKQSQSASWSDHMAVELEIREILKYLKNGDNVLDVGCANGYSTIKFAMAKNINIKGIDYIPEMIRQANIRLGKNKEKILGSAAFAEGNILDLKETTGSYDKVIIIRVLINLNNWAEQVNAISKCSNVLKRGGLLLISEATLYGWKSLNKLREEWGMPFIPMPEFNEYIDESNMASAKIEGLRLIDMVDFSSTYFIGTRFIKPILIKALGLKIDPADPEMEWNRLFAKFPSWGGYGVQKLFIFKKQ